MDYHFDVVQNKNHLVVPRLVINSMPQTWQKNFAALLSEMNCTVDWPFTEIRYVVTARDSKGRMQSDPFQNWFAIPRLATRKEFRLHGIKRSS